eukprot:403335330
MSKQRETPTPTPTPSGPSDISQERPVDRVSDSNFDFDQFYFNYAKYHYNPNNKLIHLVFIPCLVFTLFAMLHHGPGLEIQVLGNKIVADISFLLPLIMLPIYLYVDVFTGFITTLVFIPAHLLSLYLYSQDQQIFQGYHFKFMLAFHILSWITQIIGHAKFEKRAPALTDNVLLIFVAPFFFVFELLYRLGYKKDRIRGLNKLIAKEIDFYRKQNKIK